MDIPRDAINSLESLRDELIAYKRAYCAEHILFAVTYYTKVRSAARGWSAASNESRAEYQRRYQLEHRERMSDYHRMYYLEHRERIAKLGKAYQHANRARVRIARRERHLRKLRNGGRYTRAEWNALCDWFGNVCLCCGANSFTVDHVIPSAQGGVNSISNLQPLCRECNARKFTKTTDYRDPDLLAAFLNR